MEKHTITLDVEKFKEVLIYSWKLLSLEQKQELIKIDIYPLNDVTNK